MNYITKYICYFLVMLLLMLLVIVTGFISDIYVNAIGLQVILMIIIPIFIFSLVIYIMNTLFPILSRVFVSFDVERIYIAD